MDLLAVTTVIDLMTELFLQWVYRAFSVFCLLALFCGLILAWAYLCHHCWG